MRQRKEIQKMSRSIVPCRVAGAVAHALACRGRLQPAERRTEVRRGTLKRAPQLAFLLLLFPTLAAAAIWPDTLGAFHRVSAQPATPAADQAIWDEYGLREGETAQYEGDGQKLDRKRT